MDKRIKKLWIDALLSGDYKQSTGQLREENSFCCLGVLCNLHALEHPRTAAKQKYTDRYMKEEANLPLAVMRWAGLRSTDPQPFKGSSESLSDLNDYGRSFRTIAAIIDKNL